MRFVASQNPQPSWSQCYQLLLQAMDGYRLGLDPADFPSGEVTVDLKPVDLESVDLDYVDLNPWTWNPWTWNPWTWTWTCMNFEV